MTKIHFIRAPSFSAPFAGKGGKAKAGCTARPRPQLQPKTTLRQTLSAAALDSRPELPDHAMCRKRRTLLPTDDVAGVVAGKIDAAIGRLQCGQRRLVIQIEADPRTKVPGNLPPADVDGLCEVFATPRMQQLNERRDASSLACMLGRCPKA